MQAITPPGKRENQVMILVHPAEQRLLEIIRKLRYGTLESVRVHDGLPVRTEPTVKSIKLV